MLLKYHHKQSKCLFNLYLCMPSMKSQILSHNHKMLEDKAEERKQYNCKNKCMVDGNCLLTVKGFSI